MARNTLMGMCYDWVCIFNWVTGMGHTFLGIFELRKFGWLRFLIKNLLTLGSWQNYIYPNVTKIGYIIGHRVDCNRGGSSDRREARTQQKLTLVVPMQFIHCTRESYFEFYANQVSLIFTHIPF